MAQADGYYPRLNAAMLQSGNFAEMIVSVVGKVKSKDMANDQLEFECSDGGVVWMDSSQAEAETLEAFMNFDNAPVMEAIGSVGENNIVTVSRSSCHCCHDELLVCHCCVPVACHWYSIWLVALDIAMLIKQQWAALVRRRCLIFILYFSFHLSSPLFFVTVVCDTRTLGGYQHGCLQQNACRSTQSQICVLFCARHG